MTDQPDIAERLGRLIERIGVTSKGLLGHQPCTDASTFLVACADVERLLMEVAALPPSLELAGDLGRLVTEVDQVARGIKAKLRASQLISAALKAGLRKSSVPATYGPPPNGAVSALHGGGRLYI